MVSVRWSVASSSLLPLPFRIVIPSRPEAKPRASEGSAVGQRQDPQPEETP